MPVMTLTTKTGRAALGLIAAVALGLAAQPAAAQEATKPYAPAIWVDPDGCEHWVMDDGMRGFMDIHLDREGRPVCKRGNACAVMNSDQLFATGSATVSSDGRKRLADFFRKAAAGGYIIAGHTDATGSDEANMRLSVSRAGAVAGIGKASGARIVSVTGYGERQPKASNSSASGMKANRRVEIFCIR